MPIYVALMVLAAGDLPAWTFDTPEEARAWQRNGHLDNVKVRGGILYADAVDWDPFFTCQSMSFEATPYQCVRIRIRSDRSGTCELFWSGTLSGRYGGFTPEKSVSFAIPGGEEWHEAVLFPGWHREGTIRQLRLDVFEGGRFAIDSIAVESWAQAAPDTTTYEWPQDAAPWTEVPGTANRMAPPLRLDVSARGWASVTAVSDGEAGASLLWMSAADHGMKAEDFTLKGDGRPHTYNLELMANPAWKEIVALGVRLPAGARIEAVALSEAPAGPAEIELTYFGFENAVNRAGRECSILAQLTNSGGAEARNTNLRLTVPAGLRLVGEPVQTVDRLDYADRAERTWRVVADAPGAYTVELAVEGDEPTAQAQSLTFLPAMEVAGADYVPEPRPIQTATDVCAYYFPGWESDAKWDCIRRVAPIRKPLLGYYDESNPECVDWQIKWARENGISCFLVDWYWSAGNQHLVHWFEAYRKARYRDRLKVAIMWANHNAPHTHSREDWRNVTREWIDRYFNLPAYYRIDGRPAVFIWAPDNIRHDLGNSAEVRAAFDESQRMARDAGYPGIHFVAMQAPRGEAHMRTLADEGYAGATSYHEWGNAEALAPQPRHWRYEDLVETAPQAWRTYHQVARRGGLAYYPVVDTGWDARPWHGAKSHVIGGRTPELFESLLRESRKFVERTRSPFVILAPLNEWGEGSYIEPAVEYDFAMYETVRRVFGVGDPQTWPVNIAPADVGRGPYDYPKRPPTTSWTWEDGTGGWRALMDVSDLRLEDRTLRFSTVRNDPALIVDTPGLRAAHADRFEVRMRCTGPLSQESTAQLFWTAGGPTHEAASIRIPLIADGQAHTYTADLAQHPLWRGPITGLRFDPCDAADVDVTIESIRLVKEPEAQ